MAEDRLFNKSGRRHHRKQYSLAEVRAGFVILGALCAIGAWVAWMGAHPDPALFSSDAALLLGPTRIADRGPLPENLALEGWREDRVGSYDPSNVYEKINGREGFYKSFGFVSLHTVALLNEHNPARAVDIELYDLGTSANALGAFAGEKPAEAKTETTGAGLMYRSSNALFLTLGQHYLRAIGSGEDAGTRSQLDRVRTSLQDMGKGSELPWAYALFVRGLGQPAGAVDYQPENAYSFGFAKHFYGVTQKGTEQDLFVAARRDDKEAGELSAALRKGFSSYGEVKATRDGIPYIQDRYIQTVAAVSTEGPFVYGVKGAASIDAAAAALGQIKDALGQLDDASRSAAIADAKEKLGADPVPGAGARGVTVPEESIETSEETTEDAVDDEADSGEPNDDSPEQEY